MDVCKKLIFNEYVQLTLTIYVKIVSEKIMFQANGKAIQL